MAVNTKHYFWHLSKSLFMAIIALSLAGIGWMISTESGLQSLVSIIGEHLPGTLQTEGLSGTLLSKVHANKMHYQDSNSLEVNIEDITLQPDLVQLFASRIAMKDLNIKRIQLNIAKKKAIKQLPSEAWLPHLHIPSLHLNDLPQWDVKKGRIHTLDIQFSDGSRQQFVNTLTSSQLHRDTFIVHLETENPDQQHFTSILDINGTPQQYNIKCQLNNEYIQLPLSGKGNTNFLTLTLPKTQTPAGTLAVTSRYQSNPPSLQVNIEGEQLQLEKLSPNYHGNINLQAHITANNQQQELNIPKLTGTYFNLPLQATAFTSIDAKGLNSIDGHISLGEDQIDVQFDRQKSWLEWSASVKQLATFFSSQSGRLITQGKFTPEAIHASATGSNLATAQWHLDQLQFNLDGTPKQHHVKLQITNDDKKWASHASGHWDNDTWQAHLDQFELQSTLVGQWQLQAPTDLNLNRNNITIAPFCWQHEHESVCGNISLSRTTSSGEINLNAHDINLEPWSKMLSQNMILKGKGSLLSEIKLSPKEKFGDIQAIITQGRVFDASGIALSDAIHQGELNAQLNKHGLNTELTITFTKAPPLHAQWQMPKLHQSLPMANQPILGHLTWTTNALGILNLLDFNHPSGTLQTNLQANGTLGSPKITGDIKLSEGKWTIPWLNLALQNANLDINSLGDHADIHGQVTSGKGILHLKGSAKLKENALTSSIDLTGENVTVENTPDLMLVASPNLTLTTANNSIRITGDAVIPKGEIRFQDFSNTILLPEDATFTHDDYNSPTQATLSHHIELTLGKEVNIKTYGIKGLLTGNLILHKEPYRNTMVDGQLHLNHGTYSTYGITLNIEQGMLNYTNNPFWSPWLSLTAIRDVKSDTTPQAKPQATPKQVGISLEGPISHLRTEYFSRPSGIANQQQILSYLISGHSSGIDPSTIGRNALLFNTLQMYGLNKTSPLGYTLARIKDSLNLSEFTLDLYTPTPFSTMSGYDDIYTSLLIGKQLSKRLYVKSNIGMPIGSLTLSYQLAKRWSIQASSSYGWSHESHPLETGADLFYNF